MKLRRFIAGLTAGMMLFGTLSVSAFAENDTIPKSDENAAGQTNESLISFSDSDTAEISESGEETLKDLTSNDNAEAVASDDIPEGYTLWNPGKRNIGSSTNAPKGEGQYGTIDGENVFIVNRYINESDEKNLFITSQIKINEVLYKTVIDMKTNVYPFVSNYQGCTGIYFDTGIEYRNMENALSGITSLKNISAPTEEISKWNLPSNYNWSYFNPNTGKYTEYQSGSEFENAPERVLLYGANTRLRSITYSTDSDKNTKTDNFPAYYTVTFDFNGGISKKDGQEISSKKIVLTDNTMYYTIPTREDYIFDGWDISHDDLKMTITFTAKWKNAPCKHQYTEEIINPATCTQQGTKKYTCSLCNDTYTEPIPALGHDYTETVITEATCTEKGSKTLTCTRGDDTHTEDIEPLGHDFVNGICSRCHIELPMTAQIGDNKYETLQDAINAAENGDTIVLIDNIDHKGMPYTVSGKKITIDLNGKYIKENINGDVLVAVEGAELTVDGTKSGSQMVQEYKGNYSSLIIGSSSTVIVNGGTYISAGMYGAVSADSANIKVSNAALCGSYGNVSIVENGTAEYTNVTVNAENGADGIWVQYNGSAVIKSGTYNGTVTAYSANVSIEGGIFNSEIVTYSSGTVSITGGNFANDVSDFAANGYYVNPTGGRYEVLKAYSTIKNTAKTTNMTITLDELEDKLNADPSQKAEYSVEISSASREDKEKIENTANIPENSEFNAVDIKVKKTVDGAAEYVENVPAQTVTVKLQSAAAEMPKVYYIDNGNAEEITNVNWSAETPDVLSFEAPHFSTYAFVYKAVPLSDTDITKNVGLTFEETGSGEYSIILKALDAGTKINRFMSGEFKFTYVPESGNISYTVKAEKDINLVTKDNGAYEFNLDGINSSGLTGSELVIGKVYFSGYGKGTFKADETGINIVNTAQTENNIVDSYIPNGSVTAGSLILNDTEDGIIDIELKAIEKELTVNVVFNNPILNNEKSYQNMKAVISGGDLAEPITIDFGNDNDNVTFENNTYTFTQMLTHNSAYTVTISGAGYRTARYTVLMTADKTLKFWNNVMDNAVNVEEGVGTAKNVTFLAGDIAADNQINIYDLSAVVSYFGTDNLVKDHKDYAKYDLNRDGKIDSKDIAYVLVSWGN